MTAPQPADTTVLLTQASAGDSGAAETLMTVVYDEFRRIAAGQLRRESSGHTLQPTALVHEAYLKLIDQNRVNWQGRTHFLAVGAETMRRILVDHARRRDRTKRGGGRIRVQMDENLNVSTQRDEDVLAMDEALVKLAELDPRQARIVELRFFAGMTTEEVAECLGISRATVDRQWRSARAWLRMQLSTDDHRPDRTPPAATSKGRS